MKKTVLNIGIISTILTCIGYLVDSDVVVATTQQRIAEFLFMNLIIFVLISLLYFGITAVLKKFKRS
jgi:hypothetical protein